MWGGSPDPMVLCLANPILILNYTLGFPGIYKNPLVAHANWTGGVEAG
jgi:hypothetical protein